MFPRVLALFACGLAQPAGESRLEAVLGRCANLDADRCRDALQAIVQAEPLAHFYLGLVAQQHDPADAEAAKTHYEAVLRHDDSHVDALNNLGKLHADAGDRKTATPFFDRALSIDPNHRMARVNLALQLHAQGLFDAAIDHWGVLLDRDPRDAEASYNAAVSYQHLGRVEDAAAAYLAALDVRPGYAEARINLAALHHRHGALRDALPHYDAALASLDEASQSSLSTMVYNNRGLALSQLGEFSAAKKSFQRALALSPGSDEAQHAKAHLFKAQLAGCDFEKRDEHVAELLRFDSGRLLKGDGPVLLPFDTLVLPVSGAWRLKAAIAQSRLLDHHGSALPAPRPAAVSKGTLRVAYLCFDFNDHPTAHLVEGLFKWHRRLRLRRRSGGVRAAALSYGKDDGSDFRAAISRDADAFVNLVSLGHRDATLEARKWPAADASGGGAHIAVDLQGHTLGTRMELVAMRVAPVQVAYLIFPGTCGARFIDAAIVDKFVVPPESAREYSEKLVYLPKSYQVNDYERHGMHPSSASTERRKHGLPANAVVLANFNKADKLDPASFRCWLGILQRLPYSVLWLLRPSEDAAFEEMRRNLGGDAAAAGVDPNRIVWAGRVPKVAHLRRHLAADLFLDTFVYGAHSTATDALRGGLPLLTLAGGTFPARVGLSLLDGLALDGPAGTALVSGLVTHSLKEFQDVAIRLCTSPDLLKAYRNFLVDEAHSAPLFDTQTFTRRIERAYHAIWEAHVADGKLARHVVIPARRHSPDVY